MGFDAMRLLVNKVVCMRNAMNIVVSCSMTQPNTCAACEGSALFLVIHFILYE